MKNICVFGGASPGHDSEHIAAARVVGEMVAARGFGLVFGGGGSGMMGATADGAIAAGGHVHGVMPEFLKNIEIPHDGIAKLTITENMPERKALMYESSAAFITLPGGIGTMEELLEVVSQRLLKIHNKPICIFNHKGYWQGMNTVLTGAEEAGYINWRGREIYDLADSLDAVGDFLDRITG